MKDEFPDEQQTSAASVDLLLRNIRALLRVAAETARELERKSVLEKSKLFSTSLHHRLNFLTGVQIQRCRDFVYVVEPKEH